MIMKKTSLLIFLTLPTAIAKADKTDWLNFATGEGGEVEESVFFRSQGKLMFEEKEMVYEDSDVRKIIPYSAGKFIFFSETHQSGIDKTLAKTEISLDYSQETQNIILNSIDAAAQISLVSMEGLLLRTISDSQSISVAGLPQGIIIAIAECQNKTVAKKFILK